ncbi:hypothetical protein K443DRAFT_151523 [Laccaria amethystina LaAM-08-1]|uniref:Peptidase S53 activation domain-containing protein n=1 Tax=Laccaria amethystina LaAM-08-1 TaxID=1095629 RepID=A0A0C9YIB6_9AGAR|nr:hypothetical protein K443DRAFT_151523 [Laccaria amethystina LaAM-08-1]
MDDLIANLMEISDPAHDRYPQHLSRTEVASFLAHHPSCAGTSSPGSHSIKSIARTLNASVGNEWATLRISVAEVERMLGAKYSIYHNSASRQRIVQTLTYSLPRKLHQHIDVVAPTTYFGTFHSNPFLLPQALATDPAGVPRGSCQTAITPACLRALHNTDYVPVSASKNKTRVTRYLDDFVSTSDLQVCVALSRNGVSSSCDS